MAKAVRPLAPIVLSNVDVRHAGSASGVLSSIQQLGGAIGVAVVSSIAASRFHTLVHHGASAAAALTGGFSTALWVCGLLGVLALPMVFVLVRRGEITEASAARTAQPQVAQVVPPVPAPALAD